MSVSNVVWLPAFSFLQMNLIHVLQTIFNIVFFVFLFTQNRVLHLHLATFYSTGVLYNSSTTKKSIKTNFDS